MQKYSSIYASIIVVIIGWFGLAGYVTDTEIGAIVDNIIILIGIISTIYNRHKQGDVTVLGFKK